MIVRRIAILFKVTFNAMMIRDVMSILVTFKTEDFSLGGGELLDRCGVGAHRILVERAAKVVSPAKVVVGTVNS
jgi:hypothetical protein